MNKKEFNLYSEVLLNIFDNNFNNIEDVIEEIKKIIPSIRIYIHEFNSKINSNGKGFSKDNIYSIENLLVTLKNNENINPDYSDIYIKENYEYHYNILKSQGIENFIVYPYNIIDEIYGYIYICTDDKINKINYTIELIANLLIKNIEKIYSNNNEIITLYNETKKGIMLNEFKFVYQPKFNIKSNQIIGAEVLIRWHKSDGNIIYPDKFIDKLEDKNLIYLIDYYTIEECLKRLNDWSHLSRNNIIPLSINLSKSTLMRHDFLEVLESIIKKYDVDLKYIEFEITEREYVDYSIQEINDKIYSVRELGIKISLDDFGSGNSNLSFSMNIDLDIIKIDKSIINKIGKNEKIDNFLLLILELANKNNIDLVAEGIETKDQLEFLIDNGYKFGQGYYFSKPIDAEVFENKYIVV